MKWSLVKNCSIPTIFLLIYLNLKLVFCLDSTVNLKEICELSTERLPTPDHNVTSILLTYENCLRTLDTYPKDTRSLLLNQLMNKLECFKEDLKQSYYEGNVKYNDIELVEYFENNMHGKGIHFRDNGLPKRYKECTNSRLTRSTGKHIIPLILTGTLTEKQKACEALFRNKKALFNNTKTEIPTPKFDNNVDPKELIVPLASPATYNVNSPEAENALTKFYTGVMKCLTLTNEHTILIFKFNKKFYNWLTQAVLPHLKDDKCYPALGGVLRIVETMRQNDFVPKNATANFIFYRQKDLEKNAEGLRNAQDNTAKIIKSPYFGLILVPWLLFILLFLTFLEWRTGYCMSKCCGDCDKNLLLDNEPAEVFYYPIEDGSTISLNLEYVNSANSPKSVSRESEKMDSRQRGGYDYPSFSKYYSMTYEQENSLEGLPLKRQWESKNSSASHLEVTSPGKRHKKM